jgi:RNA polymerase sigma-70 factor (ECF subfamily)
MRFLGKRDRRHLSLETTGAEDDEDFARESAWHADSSAMEQLEEALLRRSLLDALDGLPAEHRAVLILRVLEQRSYEEIAQTLDIAEGTVMSRIHRARQRLREALRGWTPEGKSDEPGVS